MRLLVVMLYDEAILDQVLTVLLDYELMDAVVLEARTGLELLEKDLPIFAGLRSLVPGGIDFCRLVVAPVPAGIDPNTLMASLEREIPRGEFRATTALLLPVSHFRTI